jgi:hypothetical protein
VTQSPYLSLVEAAVYLRYVDATGAPQTRPALKFLQRQHVPMKRRGRALLVHRDALEAVLTPAGSPPFLGHGTSAVRRSRQEVA